MANRCELPQHEIDALVRHFLPQIKAFFESEEGQKEYDSNKVPWGSPVSFCSFVKLAFVFGDTRKLNRSVFFS